MKTVLLCASGANATEKNVRFAEGLPQGIAAIGTIMCYVKTAWRNVWRAILAAL
jgi:hypothetical protein